MVIVPTESNVYYEWLPVPDKWKSILLPVDHAQRTRIAVIRAVGPKCEFTEPGDVVLLSAFTGADLFLVTSAEWSSRESHRICEESEIMAFFPETEEKAKEYRDRLGKLGG